jgi:sulfur relay (sulfurtransferase) DsrF/TusC family protein
VLEFQRDTPSSQLRRDGHYGAGSAGATFTVQADPAKQYNVRVYVGDTFAVRNQIQVTVDGAASYTIASLAAGTFDTRTTLAPLSASGDGLLTVTIKDLSPTGSDPYWVINGIDVWETGSDPGVQALRAEGGADRNVCYSDIGAYKLLTEIKNTELLKQYVIDTLGKLEQYDIQNKSDFTEILRTFLMEDGSFIKTASRLFMHRNTLQYKINKIQEILEVDLSDPKVRFEINLGFKVKRLLSE